MLFFNGEFSDFLWVFETKMKVYNEIIVHISHNTSGHVCNYKLGPGLITKKWGKILSKTEKI